MLSGLLICRYENHFTQIVHFYAHRTLIDTRFVLCDKSNKIRNYVIVFLCVIYFFEQVRKISSINSLEAEVWQRYSSVA